MYFLSSLFQLNKLLKNYVFFIKFIYFSKLLKNYVFFIILFSKFN